MKKKKNLVMTISMIVLTLIIIAGSTYAFFELTINNDNAARADITAKNLKLEFTDGPKVELTDVLPGATIIKTFSVENTGTETLYYTIYLNDVINTFTRNSDLVYTITSTNDGAVIGETELPKTSKALYQNIEIPVNTTQDYTLTITYKNLSEDQNADMGKMFSGTIGVISGVKTYNLTGYAYDNNGDLMNSGTVEVHSDVITAPIQSNGSFTLVNVPVGDHEIIIKDSSNTTIATDTFKLEENNTTSIIDNNIKANTETLAISVNNKASDDVEINLLGNLYTVDLTVNNGYVSNTVLSAYAGKKTNTVTITPEIDYKFDSITCDNNIEYTLNDNSLYINSLTTNGSCTINYKNSIINLYNMMASNASNDIINFSVNSKTSGTHGIYTTTATEGNTPVYYYRGDADKVNNNVIFNNMCWKIIRTTETGGVKLIYNGTPTNGECTATGTNTQIGTSAFNIYYYSEAFIGYVFGTPESESYEEEHTNTYESTIKTYIDSWFSTNFNATTIAKLEDAVFCNDRSTKAYDPNTIGEKSRSLYGALGYGHYMTLYSAAHRASYFANNPNPSLICTNSNDKFTVSSANGNGDLTYPVGLITLDEAVLAGYNTYYSNASDYKNTTNYLHSDYVYWTMTPVWSQGYGFLGNIHNSGYIEDFRVERELGVRPVVSLTSGTTAVGSGTTTNPYVVQ